VKKSVFFYQPGVVNYTYPSSVNWGVWWSWDQADAFAVNRAYDYVHVTAAWWAVNISLPHKKQPSVVTLEF
jgi:hypothetical protein